MGAYYNDKHKGSTPWFAKFRYTDENGNKQVKIKRGFRTKTEAIEYEKNFIKDIESDKEYLFEKVVEFYLETVKNDIKLSTAYTKEAIIYKFIIPAFKGKDIREIITADLTKWQNKYLFEKDGNGNRKYTDTYIKTVNNQLRAIFNFAYNNKYISENPVIGLKSVGSKESKREYITWSTEDIWNFLNNITDYEDAYLAYMILFFTGLRKGELLALTVADFDYKNKTLAVSKTYSKLKGKEYIRSPKTEKSNRFVDLPDFLCDEIQNYIDLKYKPSLSQRIFLQESDSFLETAMKAGLCRTGLPKIRIHDSRHSHTTNLSDLDIPLKEIADRLGQKGTNITIHYSHSTAKGKSNLIRKLEMEGENSKNV